VKYIISILFIISATKINANELKTKCIAHRGNNKYYLENSIASIRSAAELESDGIEIDIRHTKDGQAILMHDSTLKRVAKNRQGRTCPLDEKIKDLSIIDIRSNCQLKNGENIPLLIEALEAVSLENIDWFIELKDYPTENTAQIIKSYIPKYQNKKVISFKRKTLRKFRKLAKKIGAENQFELFKLYRFYLFHQKEFHADVHFSSFNIKKLLKQKTKIQKAVWTVDGSKKLEEAFKSKVEYITTNDPELCLFLKARMIKQLRLNQNLSSI